jgi:hypothetical protein
MVWFYRRIIFHEPIPFNCVAGPREVVVLNVGGILTQYSVPAS